MAETNVTAGVDVGKKIQALKADLAVAKREFDHAQERLHKAVKVRKEAVDAEARAQSIYRKADTRMIELFAWIEILAALNGAAS